MITILYLMNMTVDVSLMIKQATCVYGMVLLSDILTYSFPYQDTLEYYWSMVVIRKSTFGTINTVYMKILVGASVSGRIGNRESSQSS